MLRSAILDLMDWRLQLMTGTFTLDHLRDLRLRITSHIDSGNRYSVTLFSSSSSSSSYFTDFHYGRISQETLMKLCEVLLPKQPKRTQGRLE
jgi:hypothetical protein